MQCLNCKKQNSDFEFQEIFDDVGIELQLSILLQQYFHLQVQKDETKAQNQVLCQECVDKLINLLDVDEYEKQQLQKNKNSSTESELKESYHIEHLDEENVHEIITVEDNNDNDEENAEQDGEETSFSENVEYLEDSDLEEYSDDPFSPEDDPESPHEDTETSSHSVSKIKTYNCDVCYMTFSSSVKCSLHRNLHALPVDVQVYVCTQCGILAHERDDFTCETWSCDCEAEMHQEIISAAFCCEYCGKNYKSPKQLMAHRATNVHSDLMYICELCKETFIKLQQLCEHLELHKNYEVLMKFPLHRLFLCNIVDCEKTFTTWTMLHRHKLKAHDYKTCKNCQQLFSRDQLSQHKSLCHKSETFSCEHCEKIYKSKMSRSVHIARSHKNNYMCKYCKASFKKQSLLLAHVDYRHVPIKCDKCHKVMKNRRNYDTHERAVHQQMQRYPCRHCQKGYYYRNERDAHEKTVHADIAYKCSECKFSTKYERSLELHLAKHNNQLPFKCPICAKSFARKQVLKTHLLRHKSEKPFECSKRIENGCSASFYSNHLLNKHIKKYHTSLSGRQSGLSSVK